MINIHVDFLPSYISLCVGCHMCSEFELEKHKVSSSLIFSMETPHVNGNLLVFKFDCINNRHCIGDQSKIAMIIIHMCYQRPLQFTFQSPNECSVDPCFSIMWILYTTQMYFVASFLTMVPQDFLRDPPETPLTPYYSCTFSPDIWEMISDHSSPGKSKQSDHLVWQSTTPCVSFMTLWTYKSVVHVMNKKLKNSQILPFKILGKEPKVKGKRRASNQKISCKILVSLFVCLVKLEHWPF